SIAFSLPYSQAFLSTAVSFSSHHVSSLPAFNVICFDGYLFMAFSEKIKNLCSLWRASRKSPKISSKIAKNNLNFPTSNGESATGL
ncbi:hypothetical protein M514_25654, partial [Trichuris suis]